MGIFLLFLLFWTSSFSMEIVKETPVARVKSLKKICIGKLIKGNDAQIKDALIAKRFPNELMVSVGRRMLKKGPSKTAIELLPTFDSCFFPHLLLSVLTMKNPERRQKKTLWYGLEMSNIAQERGDHHLKLFLRDMLNFARQTEPLIKDNPLILPHTIKELLLWHALGDMLSIVPVRTLCEHNVSPVYGYLEKLTE